MTRHLEVSRDIAASRRAAYDAIAHVTRVGQWSPECHLCEWTDGADGPAVGAKFGGHNANSGNEWTTQGVVTAADPGQKFAFDCLCRDFHFAWWVYQIEPTDDGCRVTEIWDDFRPDEILARPSISGVEDRAEFNRRSMATTLDRIAAATES